MENMKSYVEALDQSESEMIKILKKPLEGLQNEKNQLFKSRVIFFRRVAGLRILFGVFFTPFGQNQFKSMF